VEVCAILPFELLSELKVKLAVRAGVGLGLLPTITIANVREIGFNNNKESKEVVIINFGYI
jgi:hypothetical protein